MKRGNNMHYDIVSKEKIKIVGIFVRTTNENKQAMKDIGLLWDNFYSENISEQIPNKYSDEVISLYTDYEKDFTKPYTVVIGYQTGNLDVVPDGMVQKAIPAAKYAVFEIKGKLPDELIKTWQYIWDSNLERTYTGDFEVYKSQYEVDVYVAIR